MSSPTAPSSGTFRATVGERVFELRFEGGTLLLDEEPTDYTFERLADGFYALRIDGRSLPVVIEPAGGDAVRVTLRGRATTVRVQDETDLLLERFGLEEDAGAAEREIRAPMPGLVLNVLVEPGREIREGEGLLVLEAMKMENELRASAPGTVQAVHVEAGEAVDKNALLIELE